MNHQYYLIRRLYVRPGGQEQLCDIRMSLTGNPQEGRPSLLIDRERDEPVFGNNDNYCKWKHITLQINFGQYHHS